MPTFKVGKAFFTGTVSFLALIESAGKVTELTGAGGVTGGCGVVCADTMPLIKSAVRVSSSFNLVFMVG